jgi:hypothetical protein
VIKEYKVTEALKALGGQPVRKAPKEKPETRGHRETKASLDHRAMPDCKVPRATKVTRAQKGQPVPRVTREDRRDPRATPDPPDRRGPRVTRVAPESKARKVIQENQGLRADPLVR